jgi:hypothetical protein
MCVPSSVDLLCTMSRADEGPKSESTQLNSTQLSCTLPSLLCSTQVYSTLLFLLYSTLRWHIRYTDLTGSWTRTFDEGDGTSGLLRQGGEGGKVPGQGIGSDIKVRGTHTNRII